MTTSDMSQLQLFQFLDKYARWNDGLGRRESWEEACARATAYLIELSDNKLSDDDYSRIFNAMLNMEAMPSMRLFAMAGAAARRSNITLYNCSYLPVDSIESFVEAMILSMSGTGVGFSVEKRYVDRLPVVQEDDGRRVRKNKFVVEDSAEGWADAFREGLNVWFFGGDIQFDFSQVRPAGSILKTKGGRASGPRPLSQLLKFAKKVIRGAVGRKLTTVEAYDIMTKVADCVVSGGVRRSAMICLFDYDDTEMRHAKDNGWWKEHPHRANANNSVVVERMLSKEEVEELFLAMHEGGGGEPGFFYRVNVNQMNPQRRENRGDWGTNPCQPGFATILTRDGIKTMADVGIGDEIWSGDGWTTIVDKWSTGVKGVYNYRSSFGQFVGTENHRVVCKGQKVEAKNAQSIDACAGPSDDGVARESYNPQYIMDGLVLGDGSVHVASNNLVLLYIGENDADYYQSEVSHLIGTDRSTAFSSGSYRVHEVETSIDATELPLTHDRVVPDRFFNASKQNIAAFLRGLYSANGSVVAGGARVTLKRTSLALIQQVQLLLSSIGIRSYITENKPSDVEWKNGVYTSRTSYDLNITQDRDLFVRMIGFLQAYKNDKISPSARKARSTGIIQSVEYLGEHEVFDITVDNESHTYWTGGLSVSNCGEINLRPRQFCNLSQAVLRSDDTFATLAEKVKIATIIGTIQSSATFFPGLTDEWRANSEDERLLGVDITGQMDNPHLLTSKNLRRLRKIAIDANRDYAKLLEISQSAAVTCNKPSGNSSVLMDCSPGLHSRWSDYYIRRVRVSANSPLRHLLEQSGFNLLPENGQEYETATTLVAEFPVKAPDGAITNGDRSAVEQLEWWKRNKLNWTEHNPSVTISYKPHEVDEIVDWLYDNQSIIGGISFLPYNDHYYPLAPYEAIDRPTYERMAAELPQIDFSLLKELEFEDNTSVAQELACVSGSCEI